MTVTPLKPPTGPDAGYTSEEVWFQQVWAAVDETVPDLLWPTSVHTFNMMRREPQLAGVLGAYTLPIRRAQWQINPDGARPAVARMVADDLGLRVRGDDHTPTSARVRGVSWAEHLRSALLHLPYGHFAFELGATINDTGQARLTSLSERLPYTIVEMQVSRNGGLTGVSQYGMPGDHENPQIPATQLLWYVHDREGAAWEGVSLLRPAYSAWVLKRELLRIHATGARRFSAGVPQVRWLPGSNPTAAQHAAASGYAQSLRVGETAGGALPPGAVLELVGLSGGAPDVLAFIEYLDRLMTRQALAGILDMPAATHGSRALGETVVDFLLLSQQAIAEYVADTLTRQVAARITEWNFGPDEPVPAVEVGDVGASHAVTAESLAQLLQFGALAPDPALDAYVRYLYGLPDRTIAWAPPKGGNPAAPGQPPTTVPPAPAPTLPPGDTQAGAGRTGVAAAAAGPAGGRPATDVEQQAGVDFTAHQQTHQQAVDALAAAWPVIATAMVLALAEQAALAVTAGTLSALGSLAVPPEVVAQVGDDLATAMTALAGHAAGQVVAEAAHQGVTISVPPNPGADQATDVARMTAGMLANGYQSAAARAALQTAQPDATTAQVEDTVSTVLDDMSTSTSGWVVDNLHAALSAAQAAGRTAVFAAHPPDRLIASERLDQNTCSRCADVDGREYTTTADALADYGASGTYTGCLGGLRCRGMVIGLWKG